MVNTGKPSRGCATCKRRRIKCDEAQPACGRCRKSGWICPGFASEASLVFRQYKPSPSFIQQTSVVKRGPVPKSEFKDRVIHLSQAVTDRSTAFFLYHYVYLPKTASYTGPCRGVHEYLPSLLKRESPDGTLRKIISAAGLAAMANAGTSPQWKHESYRLYGNAIKQLQIDLQDPAKMKTDCTLASILLMGTFEVIANARPASMSSYGNHIVAAARCVEVRGPGQFRNAESATLFTELRRLISTTSHQLQKPVPYALKRWSEWIDDLQKNDETLINRFSELNWILALTRAKIKQKAIRDAVTIASLLNPVDDMLEDWRRGLPEPWTPTPHRLLDAKENSPEAYEGGYDVYRDLWVASTWNNYRMLRIVMHESVIIATPASDWNEENAQLRASTKALREMGDGVCRSVPFILGYHEGVARDTGNKPAEGPMGVPRPGGYLLLWPLFLVGSLRTTSHTQRSWIMSTLRDIGLRMGLQLAIFIAEALENTAASFPESMSCVFGEFFPK